MGRPHIDFVQAQFLPWRHGLPGGHRGDLSVKVLSVDDRNGECSLIVRYPAGWTRAKPQYCEADEEFLVLAGAIEIDGVVYGERSYACLPAGLVRNRVATPAGAVLLTFYNYGPARFWDGVPKAGLYDERKLLRHIDTRTKEWVDDSGLNGRFLWLRRDPGTGDMSYLHTARPAAGTGGTAETHPHAQELFMLTGELHGARGIYRPGSYFWRPAGINHGPFGSVTGIVLLHRSIGGPLHYDPCDPQEPWRWNPPHRPIVPADLEAIAGRQGEGTSLFD
ncbi:MAG: hypothetical protein EXQ85_09225 [Alphaproteobacteria bacterium]|nr:hypothetical protein [Alphaproteobacteria bacterium]